MIAESIYHTLLEWPLLQIAVFFALMTLCYDLFLKYANQPIKKQIEEEQKQTLDAYQRRDENKKLRENEERSLESQAEKLKELSLKFHAWENGIKKRELVALEKQKIIIDNFKNKQLLIVEKLHQRAHRKLLINSCIDNLLKNFTNHEKIDHQSLLEKALKSIKSRD